ncbi:acetyl-CoA synthetase-like protein [Apiospora kogelbergensis]|uniref:acetyl-CoA synthetase-like protein n=1 Tax=Apiospora kogelbergensis TaxID=1337665 RepID=UPI00313260F4
MFYEDVEGRLWFATGDQAIMLEDGLVAITGRYKDIINRGRCKDFTSRDGSNCPACLLRDIGIADELAGQVPIVVCDNSAKSSAEEIRTAIVREMGTKCAPVEILRLRDLGLDDYPRTASGKVQKGLLSTLCLHHVSDREKLSDEARMSSLEMGLLQAYKKATGIDVAEIDKTASTSFFADSIALMRVRDQVRKSMGVDISVRDMADHPTVESQVLLLEERSTGGHSQNKAVPFSPASLNSLSDSIENGQKLASRVAALVNQQGLQWPRDVTAVIPAHDYMQILLDAHIIDTWNFAIAVQTTNTSIEASSQKALCAALANSPVLTSLFVESEDKCGFYITLAPTDVLWNKCISVGSPLKEKADLEQFAVDYPHHHHSRMPGPLFHAVLMRLEETNSSAMVFYLQDAQSVRLFLSDLEFALEHPGQQLDAHRDFRTWAESFQALRNSPMASLSVEYHVRRLQSLHEHKAALYPPAHVPRRAIEESPDGLDYQFDAPGLVDLKRRLPGIDASTVLKAAMAIVNVSRTGHSHALFNNFEAGRGAFPFVPDSLAAAVPSAALDAADVNGPVMEGVCNLLAVPRRESGLALLERVRDDQALLTRHAHAPLRRVLAGLEALGHGADAIMVDVHRAQFLSWVPGLLGDYARLKVSRIAIRCAAGLVIVAGIGGPRATTFGCSLRWDVANYSRAEAGRFIADVETVIHRLTSPDSWDQEVGSLVDSVKS